VTRTVIIKQSHSREFCAPSRASFLQLQHPIHLGQERLGKGEGAKKSQKLKKKDMWQIPEPNSIE